MWNWLKKWFTKNKPQSSHAIAWKLQDVEFVPLSNSAGEAFDHPPSCPKLLSTSKCIYGPDTVYHDGDWVVLKGDDSYDVWFVTTRAFLPTSNPDPTIHIKRPGTHHWIMRPVCTSQIQHADMNHIAGSLQKWNEQGIYDAVMRERSGIPTALNRTQYQKLKDKEKEEEGRVSFDYPLPIIHPDFTVDLSRPVIAIQPHRSPEPIYSPMPETPPTVEWSDPSPAVETPAYDPPASSNDSFSGGGDYSSGDAGGSVSFE
jgi:hypothetical protein